MLRQPRSVACWASATSYGAAEAILNSDSRWIAYIDAANLHYGKAYNGS